MIEKEGMGVVAKEVLNDQENDKKTWSVDKIVHNSCCCKREAAVAGDWKMRKCQLRKINMRRKKRLMQIKQSTKDRERNAVGPNRNIRGNKEENGERIIRR